MRHIMVMNAKGGCGKSTLATNLASYYATEGAVVALADFDPQRSALDWLDRRPADRAEIHGVAGYEDGLKSAPRNADVMMGPNSRCPPSSHKTPSPPRRSSTSTNAPATSSRASSQEILFHCPPPRGPTLRNG